MGNLKFYSVQIGTETRRGSFNTSHSFVCKSDKSQNEVYVFYNKKYSGLGIRVEEITEVVEDIIPETLKESYQQGYEPTVEDKLRKELKELKEGTKTQKLSSLIRHINFPTDIITAIRSINVKGKELKSETESVGTLMIAFIKDQYKELADRVYLKELSPDILNRNDYIEYTVELNGSLEEKVEDLKK